MEAENVDEKMLKVRLEPEELYTDINLLSGARVTRKDLKHLDVVVVKSILERTI